MNGLEVVTKAVDACDLLECSKFYGAVAAGLACCYVCMADRRAAVLTEKALGFRCFTLAHAVGYGPRLRYEDGNSWEELLSFLRGTAGAKAPAEDSA